MRVKQNKFRILPALLLSIFLIMFAPITASAAEAPDFSQTASLTLGYGINGSAVNGIPVTLYRVADIENGEDGITFKLSGSFREYAIELNDLRTTEEWDALAQTLAAYAIADAVAPNGSGESSVDGSLTFDSLSCGMYLAVSEKAETENGIAVFSPALISLPDRDEQNEWKYSVEVYPKGTVTTPTEKTVEYTVVKHWKNAGTNAHLANIEIALAKDGEIQSRQILSEDNNWIYSWTAKDDGSVWSVIETEVPEKYTVTVEQNQTAFYVTNTYTGETPPAPQTGDDSHIMLYVVLMAVSGLCLILLGLGRMRRCDSE